MRRLLLPSTLLLGYLCAGTLASSPMLGTLFKRQDLQDTQGIRTEDEVLNLDMVKWSEETTRKCLASISPTTPVSNRAGVIVCYNIPLLVGKSGVFSADYRLIRARDAIEEWRDVAETDYKLAITYAEQGAAIQPRPLSRDEVMAANKALEGSKLRMLSNDQFLGQIQLRLLASNPDDVRLQAVLTPNVTVMGTTKNGKSLQAQVSLEGTKFLTGVFSDGPNLTDQETEEVQNAPFVLPGQKIEIVPMGLYLFSGYLLLALGIFGWGTMDRAKYRDQYRQRMAAQGPVFGR